MRDHVAIAGEYIRQVLDGTIPACKWTKLACERHLKDLERQSDPEFPYCFDKAKASRVCRFVELTPHVKGRKFAGKPLILEPWQLFCTTTAFGWVRKDNGLRRFRRVYLEVSKGNGKSPWAAALCDYMAFADGEPGAEVYCAAWGKKQARVVFDVSRAMLQGMAEYANRAGITVGQHAIHQKETNSYIHPLSREAKIAEGALPYFICLDELHVHPSRELHDNLATANEKRDGSMLWSITTAGTNRAGICFEQHQYLKKVLEGVLEDDAYFGCIYSIDDGDDPWVEKTWRKANPNWGVSVNPDSIRQEAKRAQQAPSAQAAFLTKHLDVWCQTDSAWMDMRKFIACADKNLNERDFEGQECVIGLDLASKLDLLAKVKLFQRWIEGDRHIYAFGVYWTPEARIEATSNSQYKGWVIEGRLTQVDGEVNDYELVEDSIRDDCKRFQVLEVAHDQWQAIEMVSHLTKEQIKMVEVAQVTKTFDPAMKEFEALVYDGRFHYDGDPILMWAFSNVVCHEDKNGCLFPNKSSAENKIDPATALLTGLNRLIAISATDTGCAYDTRGVISI